MDAFYGTDSDSATDMNPYGGAGRFVLEIMSDPLEDQSMSFIEITLTLDTAGDQTGPIGLCANPLTVADNSNQYNLQVSYTYFYEWTYFWGRAHELFQ